MFLDKYPPLRGGTQKREPSQAPSHLRIQGLLKTLVAGHDISLGQIKPLPLLGRVLVFVTQGKEK